MKGEGIELEVDGEVGGGMENAGKTSVPLATCVGLRHIRMVKA